MVMAVKGEEITTTRRFPMTNVRPVIVRCWILHT